MQWYISVYKGVKMEQIKIQKKLWDKIVSGEKKYEFRKLSKGIESGTYEFVSVDKYIWTPEGDKIKIDPSKYNVNHIIVGVQCWATREKFGTATLEIIRSNPQLNPSDLWWWFENDYIMQPDKDSYNFVKENYVDKNISFAVYEISDVKEGKDD